MNSITRTPVKYNELNDKIYIQIKNKDGTPYAGGAYYRISATDMDKIEMGCSNRGRLKINKLSFSPKHDINSVKDKLDILGKRYLEVNQRLLAVTRYIDENNVDIELYCALIPDITPELVKEQYDGNFTERTSYRSLFRLRHIKEIDASNTVTHVLHSLFFGTYLEKITIGTMRYVPYTGKKVVKSADYMFTQSNKLVSIDLGNLDFSSINGMHEIFRYCELIEHIDLPIITNRKNLDISSAFNNATKLKSLNLSNLTRLSAKDATRALTGAINLEYVDLSGLKYSEKLIESLEPNTNQALKMKFKDKTVLVSTQRIPYKIGASLFKRDIVQID